MNKVITISREFGSGGRELGRRLAEELQIAYYDQEIVSELVKRTNFTEEYIQRISENYTIPLLPITIGRTFSPQINPVIEQSNSIFIDQNNILNEMAERSSCVIVGRCGDYILREKNPFRLFVYADMEFKIKRCREKALNSENLTTKELKQQIRSIDKKRAKYYQFYTGQSWGEKSNYDLCINTSYIDIKKAASMISNLM